MGGVVLFCFVLLYMRPLEMHCINSPKPFLRSVPLCFNTCITEFYKLFIIALKDVCFLEEVRYNYETRQPAYFYKKLSLTLAGWLSWLEHHSNVPRLWIRSPGQGTYRNQPMNA